MIHTKLKLAAASLLLVATGSAALLGQVSPPGGAGRQLLPARKFPAAECPARPRRAGRPRDARAGLDRRHQPSRQGGRQPHPRRRLRGHRPGRQYLQQGGRAARAPHRGLRSTASYTELDEVKTRHLRRYGRRHQPVQGPRFRGPRYDDARLRPATAADGSASPRMRAGRPAAVCPAVGPTAARNPELDTGIPWTRSRPSGAMAANCMACHATAHPATRPHSSWFLRRVVARDIPRTDSSAARHRLQAATSRSKVVRSHPIRPWRSGSRISPGTRGLVRR